MIGSGGLGQSIALPLAWGIAALLPLFHDYFPPFGLDIITENLDLLSVPYFYQGIRVDY